MEKKPGLMIAVLDSLKKKGKMDSSASEESEDDSQDVYREHLEQISKEFIAAVEDKDHQAVADLLEEAFMCMEQAPHKEGPELEDEPASSGRKY